MGSEMCIRDSLKGATLQMVEGRAEGAVALRVGSDVFWSVVLAMPCYVMLCPIVLLFRSVLFDQVLFARVCDAAVVAVLVAAIDDLVDA